MAHPGRSVQRDGSKSKVSRGSTLLLHATSRTSNDQLARMQSTDALLSELFHDHLQQQQIRGAPQTSRSGDSGVNLAGEKELNVELEAKISKAIIYFIFLSNA